MDEKVLLVVASNEPLQSQTKESLDFAIESNAPIVVVLNKIDLPNSDPQNALINVLNHTNQLAKKRPLTRSASSRGGSPDPSRSFRLDGRFYSILQPGPICCAVQVSAKNQDNINDLKRALSHAYRLTSPKAGSISLSFFLIFSSSRSF